MSIIKRNKQKGFTLIELMVGIAIVGLLSSVILVATKGSTNKANIAKTMQWSRSIESLLGPYAVGIWNFDEGSGTTVSDLSGYGNDGTLVNNPTWRCAEDDSDYTPSGQGCALEFDGVDDYLIMDDSEQFHWGEKEIAVSLWIYPFDLPLSEKIFFTKTSYDSGAWHGLDIRYRDNGTFRTVTNAGHLISLSKLTLNNWNNIIITINKDKVIIYLNANKDTSRDSIEGYYLTNTKNLYIGCYSALSHFFNGFIDDVRIYETALTSVQVKALYYVGLDNLYNKGSIDKQEYQERILASTK
jgi:prepilin-type N-terminal cleavage/methylation domain-containing protein